MCDYEIDFDDLLADAEQEHMYDDDGYADDIEAELAMEAEGSTMTPLSGNTNLGPGMGMAGGVASAAAAGGGSRILCPSPLPLEQRLGVSPHEGSPPLSPLGGDGYDRGCDGNAAEAARRALNNDGRRRHLGGGGGSSPLHPVLHTDSSSRWGGDRLASGGAGAAASAGIGAGVRSRASRPQEHSSSGAASALSSTARLADSAAAAATTHLRVGLRGTVLSRPSADGDSIPFMQSGGRMMHLKVRATPTTAASTSLGGGGAELGKPLPGKLLRTPMATLMARVTEMRVIRRSLQTAEAERAAAATAAAVAKAASKEGVEAATAEGARALADSRSAGGSGGAAAAATAGGRGSGKREAAGGALWVDKYAPEGFRDLLSNEKINREVLRAVKAWDPFVFKKESTKAAAAAAEKKKAIAGMKRLQKAPDKGDPADKRPDARVIMLCGPPGLGKTTLAQVVARHAGYRVYEINASDDRTAAVLRQRITEAMEGNTLLADKRPNLIILDEVDGADGKAAAQVLVDIATAPLAKSAAAGGVKQGRRKTPLTRPLVLICNDQWAPALRPVRAISQVFVFRAKASPSRLVQRLKAICTSERLTVNTDALTRLADRSHLDVRSCLNTLQFVARRAANGGVRNASAALLTAVADGIKDERRDLFEVLRSVFTRRKSGTKRRLFLGGEEGSMADRADADVLEEVEAFNDHGKVLAGVHENFLGVRFNDPTLCKAAAAMDWLEMADLMDARTNRTQDYSFSRYAPAAVAGVHCLCRSDQRTAVTQPKKDFEARTSRAAKNNILHSFADGRQLGATGRTPEALVLDMLSHLMDILAPTLRPLNPDLMSPQERARFRGLVGILLSCGLTFAPQSASTSPPADSFPFRAAADAQEFELEPAVDQLLKYEGYDFAHPRLAAPLRPIVAHEVSLEAMRQAEASRLSTREDAAAAQGKNALADSFAAADSARKILSSSGSGGDKSAEGEGGGVATAVAAAAVSAYSEKSGDKGDKAASAGGAAAAKRKGEAAGLAGAEETENTNKKFRDNEGNRPAHPVPFWNRTNWISGRKDGTGSRGGGGDDCGSGAAASNGSAAADAGAGDNASSKRDAAQVSGGLVNGTGGGTGKGESAATGNVLPEAVEPSRRGRQEVLGAAAGADGSASGAGAAKASIRYQFRAGYTNAVRRPVRMKDLL